MNKRVNAVRVIALCVGFFPMTALASEYRIEQRDGQYVYCHKTACEQPTQKVLDMPHKSKIATNKPIAKPLTTIELKFGFAQKTLASAEKKRLQDFLKKMPDFSAVRISGHTDQVGDPLFNQYLAKARATAAKILLIQLGVDPATITTSSQCCTGNPPINNPNARRVVIQFIEG